MTPWKMTLQAPVCKQITVWNFLSITFQCHAMLMLCDQNQLTVQMLSTNVVHVYVHFYESMRLLVLKVDILVLTANKSTAWIHEHILMYELWIFYHLINLHKKEPLIINCNVEVMSLLLRSDDFADLFVAT